MLLNFKELCRKYNIRPTGVIQVGAHFGEEHFEYLQLGVQRIAYIEPCKAAFSELVRRYQHAPNVALFNFACGEISRKAIMFTGDNTVNKGQSNSLLKPALHLSIHPEVEFDGEEEVDVRPLDSLGLAYKDFDFLNMDCQGYEGPVIRGGKETLETINWVYSEINVSEVYENCTKVEELDQLLFEFKRVETGPLVGGGWTDALYIRKTLL